MGILIDLILSVFVLTALGAILGYNLDKKFNTTPWLSISFGIFAIIFGLTRLIMKSNEISKKGDKETREKGKKEIGNESK